MKRTHRPGILVTLGAVAGTLGCGGVADRVVPLDPPIGNPPPPPPATFVLPAPPFAQYAVLEPKDDAGRVIHHGAGSCWVDLPFEVAPTSVQPPPTRAVPCPPVFASDPAYAACEYGKVHLAALEPEADCVCYFTGNPPPAPKDIACPVATFPSLARPG